MFFGPVAVLLVSFVLSPNSHDYWVFGPSMPSPGSGQMMAQLHDGRVMVMGGEDVTDGFPVPTTEIYDPDTDSWSRGPSLHVGRIGATATTLRDVRVLVAGGLGPKLNALHSAEIFDPKAVVWRMTAPLPQTRFSHSATLLPDGQVLVVGGVVDNRISNNVLLFDSVTERWSKAPPSLFVHALQSATVLADGRILLAGGYGDPETYDPSGGSWRPIRATVFRLRPVIVQLQDGSVLVATGRDAHDRDLRSARIYDPAANIWTAAGSLHAPRSQAAGALLPDGRALVVGGEQVTAHVLRSAEVFDPSQRGWTDITPEQTPRDAAVAATLPNGTVMVCGGMNLSGVLRSCEMYHP
jgi:hypothetical protein